MTRCLAVAKFLVITIALGACLAGFLPTRVYASHFYFEMGAGVAQIRGAATFFGDDAPSPLSLGTSLNAAVGVNLAPADSPMGFHFGIQHRFNTGSTDTAAYSVQATYPMMRVEMHHLFIGFGLTPLVWKRNRGAAGFDGISYSGSTYAGMMELGHLWPITPAVSFAVTAGGEILYKDASYSPKPMLGCTAMLRFYIDAASNFKTPQSDYGEGSNGGYEGWRYPYGYPK